MARFQVVSTATLVLTNPNAGDILSAIENLQSKETQFYRARRDLINSYPLKRKDITTSEIESLYDAYLGAEPWNYKSRFDASGSRLRSGSYANNFYSSAPHEEFSVIPWGATPTGSDYPEIDNATGSFRFDEERGASWVDLIGNYGYNRGFTRRGDRIGEAYEGFGMLPVAYNGRGGLSDFEAHMLKLVGDAYEATVGSALETYLNKLGSYRNTNGSPTDASFSGNSVSQPWEGFTGSAGGYNRPNELSADLVRETRGTD